MRTRSSNISLHVAITTTLTFLFLCILYPFLPGAYDSLALPLSTIIQAFGVLGLLLVPVGLFWLVYEVRDQWRRKHNRPVKARRFYFALTSIVICSVVAVALCGVALATAGISLAALMLATWFYAVWKLAPKLKAMKNKEHEQFSPTPCYFIFVPVAVLLFQLLAAAPLTEWSRSNAIANGGEFIRHIEEYRTQYGRYPTSLLAQWKDYSPDVVGVEKYHYSPHGDSYNLFFEQPKFLLDNIGTREWVVYNPRDEHRMYSHTAWFLLLAPEKLDRSQGWYALHDTSHPHWKYFWFD